MNFEMEAAAGLSSAEAGIVSGTDPVGTAAKGTAAASEVTGIDSAKGGGGTAEEAAVAAAGDSGAVEVSVELAQATPTQLEREAQEPNLEMHSLRALSRSVEAAVVEDGAKRKRGKKGKGAKEKRTRNYVKKAEMMKATN